MTGPTDRAGQALRDMLEARVRTYDLLRRIFLWELPLELFADLVQASTGNAAGEAPGASPEDALRRCLASVRPEDLAATHREIHAEYTRLFLGPRHLPAPPYESVYRNPQRLMMQEETAEVRRVYARNGFRVARINQEPDDSAGMEFEFMWALSSATLEAAIAGEDGHAAALAGEQLAFCRRHLLQWMPAFCDDIVSHARLEFWKAAATLTKGIIEEDAAMLPEIQARLAARAASIE